MTLSYVTRAMLLTSLTVAGWLYLVRNVGNRDDEMEACRVNEVADADTVLLACDGEDEEVAARLAGVDAPSLANPGCDAELAHAALAADRLRALLGEGGARIYRAKGAEAVRVRISLDGEDLASRLIREGLAAEPADGAAVNWCDRLGAIDG